MNFQKFLSYFLQGLLYVAPLSLTIYVFIVVFHLLDGILPLGIPGLGIIVIFIGVTLIGIVGQILIKRPIISYFNYILNKAPFVKMVYSSIKDLVSAFVGKEKKFSQPVLVRISENPVIEKIGFVTQTDLSDLGIGKDRVTVFFPFSFAFTGELLIIPTTNITPLDIPSADAMKFIVSGGITKV
jgi:uncharacterized membrane protein